MTPKLLTAAVLVTSLMLAGCATNPDTGQQKLSNTGAGAIIGAGSGALLGALLGGRHNRTETIVGAGIGAIAGAGIGGYMDRQERDLRARTAGSGIAVVRKGDEIDLRMPAGITFDFNAATVKAQSRAPLNRIAQTLAAYPSTFVDIAGHTDAVGTDTVNQKLSEQRATAVANYLSALGVNPARIATRGYGKQFPVANNDTEAGRAENRRVEIHLSPITDQDYRETGRTPRYAPDGQLPPPPPVPIRRPR